MSQSLCSHCRTINFQKYIYESRFIAFKLGSWDRISNRDGCPFCRLVRAAILSHGDLPSSKSIVTLSNRKSWQCCTSYNEYHGVRRMDYSNEFDLHAYGLKTHSLDRYQFYLCWNGGYSRIYLRSLRPGPFFGRIVDRDRADLGLCRRWLDLCDKYHSGSSESCINRMASRELLRGYLRLIDVEEMIIVKGPSDLREYVALTYVWGEETLKQERPPGWQMPRTLRAAVRTNKYGDEDDIALPDELPYTIRDAVEVTRALGYPYLWVDSLCIIQDDKRDQDLQLSMMDEIYSNAALTIAAGSGTHADYGLPGVSRRRRYAQRTGTVKGVDLAVELPSFEELNSGTSLYWNTRGWTLQEKMLSKRLLLFTDYQMYFRCANSVCVEDIAMETGALSQTIKRRQNPFAWDGPRIKKPDFLDQVADALTFDKWKLTDKNWKLEFLPNYVALISEFTQRTFSFNQDRLKAIQGVLKTLDSSERAFPGGLPRYWLAEALLWTPRYESTYSIDSQTMGMPTWSWAAWSLSEGCIWSQYADSNALAYDEPQTTIHVQGIGESVNSYCVWISHNTLFRGNKPNTPDPLSRNARRLLNSSGTMLSFRVSVRALRVGYAVDKHRLLDLKDPLRAYYILDNKGNHIGKVWTCDRVARTRGKHQFIALSRRKSGMAIKGAVAE